MTKKVIVQDIIQETPDTKSFILISEDQEVLEYIPGQFISLIHPQNDTIRRSYSFSSSTNEPAKITVKRIDNGLFSRYLFDQVSIGDKLGYSQISGMFTISKESLEHTPKQFVFFAAGSGITPIIGMIKYILPQLKNDQKVQLIYSNSSLSSTIFYQELIDLQKKYREFQIEWMFSDAPNLLRSRLNNFLLIDLLKDWSQDWPLSNFEFYICGPIEYMDTVSITLLTEGFKNHQIRKEIFYNPDIEEFQKPLPPEQDTLKAWISFQDHLYEVEVPYPQSILQAARNQGINLPYSCESGQCGSCIAQLKKGTIWMSYNEVLTDRDLDKGLRLTCTGHPINGEVCIEL